MKFTRARGEGFEYLVVVSEKPLGAHQLANLADALAPDGGRWSRVSWNASFVHPADFLDAQGAALDPHGDLEAAFSLMLAEVTEAYLWRRPEVAAI